MLRFMDWSVVAMGCALVVGGLGSRWWERNLVRKSRRSGPDMRALWALPLLIGLGMICARVPGLLRAPHLVVEVFDALDFGLAVTALGFLLRLGFRHLRARGTT